MADVVVHGRVPEMQSPVPHCVLQKRVLVEELSYIDHVNLFKGRFIGFCKDELAVSKKPHGKVSLRSSVGRELRPFGLYLHNV